MNIPTPCQPGDPCYGKYLILPPGGPGCYVYTKSDDVIYIGTNLPNSGIKTGDCLTLALKKIDAAIPSSTIPTYIEFLANGVVTDNMRINLTLASNINSSAHNTPNVLYSSPVYYVPSINYTGDPAVTVLAFPKVIKLTEGSIDCKYITTLNFSSLKEITNIQAIGISQCDCNTNQVESFTIIVGALTTLQIASLYRTDKKARLSISSSFDVNNVSISSLQTLNLPLFTSGNIRIDRVASIQTINLPVYHDGSFSYYTNYDYNNTPHTNLTSLSLPSFTNGDITISDPLLTTLNLPSLTTSSIFADNPYTQGIELTSVGITTLNLPSFTTGGILFNSLPNLSTINLPLFYSGILQAYPYGINSGNLITLTLPEFHDGEINFNGYASSFFPNITTYNLPKFITGSIIHVSTQLSVTTLNLPLFESGNITISQIDSNNIPTYYGLTNFYLPSFKSGSINLGWCNVTTLDSTNLPVVTSFTPISHISSITSINFPNLVYFGATLDNNSNLTYLRLGSIGITKSASTYMEFYNSALDLANVTYLLDVLISLDGTNGTTLWGSGAVLDISSGTTAAPDPAQIATLVGRGTTIYHN
jgi:hypothetical protein